MKKVFILKEEAVIYAGQSVTQKENVQIFPKIKPKESSKTCLRKKKWSPKKNQIFEFK